MSFDQVSVQVRYCRRHRVTRPLNWHPEKGLWVLPIRPVATWPHGPWPDGQSGPRSGLCDGECWPLPVAHWASFAELATGRQQAWATRRASKPESTIQERGRHQPDDKEWFQAPPINGFKLPPGHSELQLDRSNCRRESSLQFGVITAVRSSLAGIAFDNWRSILRTGRRTVLTAVGMAGRAWRLRVFRSLGPERIWVIRRF